MPVDQRLDTGCWGSEDTRPPTSTALDWEFLDPHDQRRIDCLPGPGATRMMRSPQSVRGSGHRLQ